MKTFMTALLLGLTCSSAALAEQQELVSLACAGANGLKLSLNEKSNIVSTELGFFTRDFETNRTVFVQETDSMPLARIALGRVGAAHAYVYDIYLAATPVKGEASTMKGVIGLSLYNVVFVPNGGPVPMPIGFIPSTTLSCEVLTK